MVVAMAMVKKETTNSFHFKNLEIFFKLSIKKLLEKNIGIIMVEGGKFTLTEFFENKVFDEIWAFVGNKILGGENSISVFGGNDKEDINEAIEIEKIEIEKIENDILIRGRVCLQE